MTIKFKNPPINELVISTYFNPSIQGLRNEHVGIFWNAIRADFPSVSQQQPVGLGNFNIPSESEFFPMPRYWFISSDDVNIIQIQKNAFMFNWRSREGDYPHYESLKVKFDKYYQTFSDFLLEETNTENLSIDVCELMYVNTIEPCEYWSDLHDTPYVIPSFSIPDVGVSCTKHPGFNCSFVYEIASDLQLRVLIRHAQSSQNKEEPILLIEVRATGRIGMSKKSGADKWFDRAHQAIIDCFVGLTNPEIQKKYWIQVEEKG